MVGARLLVTAARVSASPKLTHHGRVPGDRVWLLTTDGSANFRFDLSSREPTPLRREAAHLWVTVAIALGHVHRATNRSIDIE